MSVLHIDSSNFNETIKEGIALVDFYATWCGPCKMLAPNLETLANEVTNIKVCKVNVDSSPDLARQFGIFSIPTLILFKDGEKINQISGFQSVASLKQFIGIR